MTTYSSPRTCALGRNRHTHLRSNQPLLRRWEDNPKQRYPSRKPLHFHSLTHTAAPYPARSLQIHLPPPFSLQSSLRLFLHRIEPMQRNHTEKKEVRLNHFHSPELSLRSSPPQFPSIEYTHYSTWKTETGGIGSFRFQRTPFLSLSSCSRSVGYGFISPLFELASPYTLGSIPSHSSFHNHLPSLYISIRYASFSPFLPIPISFPFCTDA